ncbi:MAG: GAF domain-containing protein [Chloroflexota bacterium]
MSQESDMRQALDEAHQTIAHQAARIRGLEQNEQSSQTGALLSDLVHLTEVVTATVGEAPYRGLLNGIIEAAKRLFDAGAASIALLDHETNELVFAAAAEESLVGLRFPAHQGISGWVMMTGEPIAVGDVRSDPRFARDFAASTGYVPSSILAVPMFVGDDVEGVLSVLDKASAATFGLDDMELLGLFARPAAIAVQQARMSGNLGRLLLRELEQLATGRGDEPTARAARSTLEEGGAASEETLELARLVHRLARRSASKRQLAIEILTAINRQEG